MFILFISSQDELIGWESSRRLSVRLFTLSNMNSSAARIQANFILLAGNKDIHNISNEFEIQQDRTKDYGVNCT